MPILTWCFSSMVKRADGAGRADVAAKRAVVFATAQPRHDPRRPQPFQPGLGQGRLQAAGGADLHAQTASGAAGEELPLGQRARRTDQALVARQAAGLRRGAEQDQPAGAAQHGPQGGRNAAQETASRAAGGPAGGGRRSALPGPCETEAETPLGTGRRAVEAPETLGRQPGPALLATGARSPAFRRKGGGGPAKPGLQAGHR